MKNKIILIIFLGLIVFVGGWFLNIIGFFEKPITEDDFEIKSLEYTSFNPERNTGSLELVVNTKIDNLRIGVHFSSGIFCMNECKSAGECHINWCQGDPATGFYVDNANKSHNVSICAYSGNKYKVCKDFLLHAYEH